VNGSSAQAEVRAREETKPRLCVVLGCHQVVCALPIDNIDRLVLPEAVEPVDAAQPASVRSHDAEAKSAVPEVVRVGGKHYAAWDLGVLFGLTPVSGAWVLLSLMHDGAEVALALRTGPCFAVQTLRNLIKMPGEIFQNRRGALTDGFATSVVRKAELDSNVGVLVDPKGLWTRQELQISAAVLDAVQGHRSGKQ
jgi:hypothetical protein